MRIRSERGEENKRKKRKARTRVVKFKKGRE